ncbi:MAG: FMN-binding protein [Flavobacteriales bacterium]|nr:FMN-binding protein [Flavobacteriales bacterium]
MKKNRLIIFLSLLFLSADLPQSAYKKIDKTIEVLWPNQEIQKKQVNVEGYIENNLKGKFTLSKLLNSSSELIAYMVISNANSKADFFDYMIIFKPDLTIMTIQVLIYREDYGGEIGSKRWLKQFYGKSDSSEMKFGYDIQNISGATISANSITKGVQLVTNQMHHLKSKKVI